LSSLVRYPVPAEPVVEVGQPQVLPGAGEPPPILYSRSFNSTSDNITCAVGSLADFRDGNMTVGAIIKLTDTTDASIIEFRDTGNATPLRCSLAHGSTIPFGLQDNAGGQFVGPPPSLVANVWCIAVITRTAGVLRAHLYNYNTGVWSHTSGPTVNGVNETLNAVRLGGGVGAGDFGCFGGLIAVGGAQAGTAHSDVNIETLSVGLQEWADLFTGNAAVWRLDQDSTATPVPDIVGGADQTAISGTTVVADSPPGFDWELAGGPQTIPVGQATETETAQAVGRLKVKATDQASETETAQAVTVHKTRAAGQATEVETAQPVGKAKIKAIGQAVETEVAQTVGARKTVVVGQAVEVETAQGVTVAGGQIGQAVETEVAQQLTVRKAKAAGQAIEAEQAQALTVRKARAVGQATETEAAQPVGKAKTKTAGQAVETETAQSIGRRKTVTVGQAVESELAQTVNVLGHIVVQVGQAIEVETAQPVGRAKNRAVGQALETETAQGLGRRKAIAVGQALETETAGEVVIPPPQPPPRWVEGDTTATGVVEGGTAGSGQVEGVLVGAGIVEGSAGI